MKLFGGNSGSSHCANHKQAARKPKSASEEIFEAREAAEIAKASVREVKKETSPVKGASNKKAVTAPVNGNSQPPKKKSKTGKTILIILLVVAIIAAAVILIAKSFIRPPDIQAPSDGEGEGTSADAEDVARYYTVLVCGEDQLGLNTDTIMVARFDTVNMSADVVSIPRDTVVNVETRGVKKINQAYYDHERGIDGLMAEVEDVMGFRPNNYVIVDIDVFMEVVDALGGVEFDVPIPMHYEDISKLGDGSTYEFYINVEKGPQLLDGKNALGVFRFRQGIDGNGYPGGDWQRIEVQHNLMMAIAQKAMSTKDIDALMGIVNSVWSNCETDMSIANIGWFATQFLKMSMDDIHFHTAPTTGVWIQGFSYVQLSVDPWIEMINQALNPYTEPITKEDCSILYTAVDRALVNGQHYAELEDFATTDGSEVYTNFAVNYNAR